MTFYKKSELLSTHSYYHFALVLHSVFFKHIPTSAEPKTKALTKTEAIGELCAVTSSCLI